MFCIKCGKEINEDSVFCPHCGGSQQEAAQAAAPAAVKTGVNAKTVIILIVMIAVFGLLLTGIFLWKIISSKTEDEIIEDKPAVTTTAPPDEAEEEEVIITEKPFANGLKVGEVVTFGKYEQDANLINGTEPIEWDVIGEKNGSYLLISHYVLDNLPFENGMADTSVDANQSSASVHVTWENCSIRDWLNYDFYDEAFSDEEKEYILTVTNKNSDFPQYALNNPMAFNHDTPLRAYGCSDTEDTIFLLSVDEFDEYYRPKESKAMGAFGKYYCPKAIVAPTEYAASQNLPCYLVKDAFFTFGSALPDYEEDYKPYIHEDYLKKDKYGKLSPWMLRSTHEDINNVEFTVTILSEQYCFDGWGTRMGNRNGIRPAMWVTPNK